MLVLSRLNLAGKLHNRVAIITGAASGIGKSIAEQYVKEGAKVVICDINMERLSTVQAALVASGGDSLAVKCDMASANDIQYLFDEAIKKYGKLDILVNNAGIMDGFEPVDAVTDARWERIFSVNTTGTMRTMRSAMQLFVKQNSGVIINNASIGGISGGKAGCAYTASKHAVIGMTKNTASMYNKTPIRVNAICPGGVETNIGESMGEVNSTGYECISRMIPAFPRTAGPDEVAKVAVFLASDDSSFINGQAIAADGGLTCL